jgi:hypothetical protein
LIGAGTDDGHQSAALIEIAACRMTMAVRFTLAPWRLCRDLWRGGTGARRGEVSSRTSIAADDVGRARVRLGVRAGRELKSMRRS